jgi:hypothetical protein
LVFITAVLVAVATVTILVLLTVPIAQEQSGYTLIGFRLYSFEAEHVFGSPWSNFSYRGVTFAFHVWCEVTPAAGEVCGNVTESNGGIFPFSFWDGPPSVEPRWETWVAPDGQAAIQFESLSGGLVHLLVAL